MASVLRLSSIPESILILYFTFSKVWLRPWECLFGKLGLFWIEFLLLLRMWKENSSNLCSLTNTMSKSRNGQTGLGSYNSYLMNASLKVCFSKEVHILVMQHQGGSMCTGCFKAQKIGQTIWHYGVRYDQSSHDRIGSYRVANYWYSLLSTSGMKKCFMAEK